MAIRRLGNFLLPYLHRRIRVFRPEGGTGNGGGHPHFHPDHRPGPNIPAPLNGAGERHRHRHRRSFRQRRRRRNIYASRALHSQPRSASRADHLHLHRRRLPGGPVPDSLAPLFCPRNARAVPLPGSHGNYRGPRDRRKGRISGALAAGGDRHCRIYDFFITTFQICKEFIDFQFIPVVRTLAEQAKVVFRFDAISFILGLGYVMGLRSSMVLCAGGVLSNFVLVPLIWMIGSRFPDIAVYPAATPIAQMTANEIFRGYVRFIGVGTIATAGIFGIVKSLKIVAGSFTIAARTFRKGHNDGLERTDRDISTITILIGIILSAIAVAIFLGKLNAALPVIVCGLALTVIFSFFFASVAANAIATTARNPVSGMTMLTIIISAVVLLRFGLSGTTGMFFVMAIAGMVCTSLSVSGQTITDLKTGYWLGSTPASQEKVKFLGVIAAAAAAGLTIAMLAQAYQFGDAVAGDLRVVLPAPQASIMKALVEGFMSHQPVAYILFGAGAMTALIMEMLGVPALVFALGMYLPLELNTPALVGGFIAHWIGKKSEKTGGKRGSIMRERAVIIASGLMAGGALGGVFGASLRLFPWYSEDKIKTPFFDSEVVSQSVSAILFISLCLYLWFNSIRRAKEE